MWMWMAIFYFACAAVFLELLHQAPLIEGLLDSNLVLHEPEDPDVPPLAGS